MFRELLIEGEKMRTNNGFEFPIAKLNKVKIEDIIKKVGAGEIDKDLVKT